MVTLVIEGQLLKIKVETQVDSASSEVLLDGQEHTLRQERVTCSCLWSEGDITF